jgi:hypothetical protein
LKEDDRRYPSSEIVGKAIVLGYCAGIALGLMRI